MANAVMFQRLKENIIAIGEELKTKNRSDIMLYLTHDSDSNKGLYTKYKDLLFRYSEKLKEAQDQGFISKEEVGSLSKMIFDKYNSLYMRVADTIGFLTKDSYTEEKVVGAYYTIDRIINNEYFDDQGHPSKEKMQKFHERISLGIKADDDKMNLYISNFIKENILYSIKTMIYYLDVKNVPFSKELIEGLKPLLSETEKSDCDKTIKKMLDDNDSELCSKIIGEFDSFYKALCN